MDAVSAATPPKLDVVRLLLAAVVAPIFHKRTLVWFALPVVAAEMASNTLATPAAGGLFMLASIVASTVLDVACYRIFLLGPESTAGHSFQWWAHRVARFFGWGLVIGFLCLIFAIPAVGFFAMQYGGDPAAAEAALASVRTRFLVFLFALPAIYVYCRLGLAFPEVAIRETPIDLAKTWRLSAGNSLRLLLVAGVVPGLLQVLVGSLLFIESLAIQTAGMLILLYAVIARAAAVSTAYRELVRLIPPL